MREERKVGLSSSRMQSQRDNEDLVSNQTVISDIPYEEDMMFCNENMAKKKKLANDFNASMLLLNCLTWNKDSHGLFDFDFKEIVTNKYKVKQSKDIIRK